MTNKPEFRMKTAAEMAANPNLIPLPPELEAKLAAVMERAHKMLPASASNLELVALAAELDSELSDECERIWAEAAAVKKFSGRPGWMPVYSNPAGVVVVRGEI
jgi:hypothetical protein